MENVERAIELSLRINRLRSELEKLTTELESIVRPSAPPMRIRTTVTTNGHTSIDDRILKVLINSDKLLAAHHIQEEMPDVPIGSIRAALSRMVAQDLVRRPERGWYTEAPPAKPEEAEPEE